MPALQEFDITKDGCFFICDYGPNDKRVEAWGRTKEEAIEKAREAWESTYQETKKPWWLGGKS